MFERPIASTELGDAEVGITAVCWARIPGRSEALLGSIYFDRDETSPVFDKVTPHRRVAETEPRLVYGHGGEFTWAFGDNEGAAPGAQFMRALAPRLRAAWLLMQQPLTLSLSYVENMQWLLLCVSAILLCVSAVAGPVRWPEPISERGSGQ
ncbi:hypothetical protein QRX50_36150 [Amycolatopsis carbonis]|uniref:Uncharacterized protein n=1 Tax=Amycolatopsis carbonis TaxID=715471 RepID=A0A9Y2MQ50_9PSEU|nr:hypothetical protein [Amycolatopsis sp. 2-15]WIX76825.1 hypothetical protein QRX50_36150 [Amycolatopsis sp. 2-15]